VRAGRHKKSEDAWSLRSEMRAFREGNMQECTMLLAIE
jgi:hypothetical protein